MVLVKRRLDKNISLHYHRKVRKFALEDCMNSTVTVKYQTTIPKAVREQLGISINDALEWIVEKGRVVVQPVHNQFLGYRGSVKVGEGDIAADILLAKESRLERYR
jgi:AbrB family looped-hinge helix DNA binding protein